MKLMVVQHCLYKSLPWMFDRGSSCISHFHSLFHLNFMLSPFQSSKWMFLHLVCVCVCVCVCARARVFPISPILACTHNLRKSVIF